MSNVAGKALAAVMQEIMTASWAGRLVSKVERANKVAPLEIKNVVAKSNAYGVRCAYENPAQLGADRWAALVAARHYGTGASCIIDCGTAMTVDVLTADGNHAGGIIIPGLGMMRDALYAGTDGVQEPAAESPASGLLACDTAGAVEGGSLYAVVAFIDRVCADMEKELDEPMTCLLTGGDAPDILPLLNAEVEHEPTLVLQGLARVAESA